MVDWNFRTYVFLRGTPICFGPKLRVRKQLHSCSFCNCGGYGLNYVGSCKIMSAHSLRAIMNASRRIRMMIESKLSLGLFLSGIYPHGDITRWYFKSQAFERAGNGGCIYSRREVLA